MRRANLRRPLAAAGLSGALLVGGAAGALLGNPLVSGAQGSTTTSPVATADATADPARPGGDHRQWMADALASLVSDGTITQAQADAVIGALETARPERGGMHGGMGRGAMGAGLDAAAGALNMTAEELRAELQSGQTLGAIADAAGVSRQSVVDAIVAAAEERLATAVGEGRLTQAEADAKAAELAAEVTEHLDDTMGGGRMGGMGRHGGMGRGAEDGAVAPTAPDSPSGSTTTTS